MMKKLILMWNDLQTRGEIFKNIGLGLFVNGAYGLSDLKVEFFNITDLIIGIFVMISGIIIERRNKWDIG